MQEIYVTPTDPSDISIVPSCKELDVVASDSTWARFYEILIPSHALRSPLPVCTRVEQLLSMQDRQATGRERRRGKAMGRGPRLCVL